jgi:Sulfotransferase domain
MLSTIPVIRTILKHIEIRDHIKKQFPNELLLAKGVYTTNSKTPSVLYFTVHRCASQFIYQIFKSFEKHSDMTHIDIGGYFWRGGKLYVRPQEIYRQFGYVYGPIYGMDKEELPLPIPNLNDFKIFLMLRDPRDVLTSYYFHHAADPYYNPAQRDFLIARSKETKNKPIDEWVLDKAPIFRARYEEYLNTFHNRPNVLFLKYEDMVADFPSWLSGLAEFASPNLHANTLQSIMRTARFDVDKEDEQAHKRQVTPGDHKRKLKQETIDSLNSDFRNILEGFNFWTAGSSRAIWHV